MSEDELVRRCRIGDRQAQQELYARTSQQIYGLALRMTGDRQAAFDIAQDTYVQAFTRIVQFEGRSSISTWLYRIAVTEALQHLRREKRSAARLPDYPTALVSQTSNGHAAASLDVHEALARLDPPDRAILLLRYSQGLDYRQIAEVLDCAGGTVGSRLHRARERMRELLGKAYGQPEESGLVEHRNHRR